MSRRSAFRQVDLTRALKGAKGAGLAVTRVEIDAQGKIVIVSGEGAKSEPEAAYDAWRAKRDARQA